MVIVVVGVVVLVMVADGDPLTTLIMVTQVKVVGKEEIQKVAVVRSPGSG